MPSVITKDEGISNPTSGYLSEETQNTTSNGNVPPYIHCNIIYNSRDMEATWASYQQMDK